jgi:2-polyprenyl-3-methyl-5-hydroxy-6-metoxy-1,4-benzoquinol methylase
MSTRNEPSSSVASRCPICGGGARPYCEKQAFQETWRVDRCQSCGHGFVANRPTLRRLEEIYNSDVHAENWDASSVTVQTLEQRPGASAWAREIASFTRSRGGGGGARTSLDVGSGDGSVSYHLGKEGFAPTLIDLDPRAGELARLVPNSTFCHCSFEQFSDEALRDSPPRRFDAVVMSQVLEHALDPLDWLRRAASLLTDDGVLAIGVPNFGGVYRALGDRDPFIHPPIHLNYFTPASMSLAFGKVGLRVAKMKSFSRLYIAQRPGVKGLALRVAQHLWNAGSPLLNLTSRGVLLGAYGKRSAAAAATTTGE